MSDINKYIQEIAEVDETLSSLRDLWVDEGREDKKDKLMGCINRGLDDRRRLMTLRDASKIIEETDKI